MWGWGLLVSFISIEDDNLYLYQEFETEYDLRLKAYQSRIYPNNYTDYKKLMHNNMLAWSYILYENKYIGSIWIEKTSVTSITGCLGIFILEDNYREKGIGTIAINQYISNCATVLSLQSIDLNVRINNPRAIACYQKCGFRIIHKYINSRNIQVLHMIKYLS